MIAVAGLAWAGCGSSTDDDAATTTSTAASVTPTTVTAAPGDPALAALGPLIEQKMADMAVPGAVVLVRTPERRPGPLRSVPAGSKPTTP